jgi:hypothetical protein
MINALGIVLLVSPLANFQVDIPQVFANISVVETKQQIIQAANSSNQDDDPDLEVAHFLGRARAYGFLDEFNFVIRSNTRQQAESILSQFVNKLNSSAQIVESINRGMGKFNSALISDEASQSQLHEFIEDVAKDGKNHRRLVLLDGLNA